MQFQALSPIFWTKNLQQTICFYEKVLGFKSRSNFPNFAALCRDNAEIMFVIPTGEPDDEVFFPKPVLTTAQMQLVGFYHRMRSVGNTTTSG